MSNPRGISIRVAKCLALPFALVSLLSLSGCFSGSGVDAPVTLPPSPMASTSETITPDSWPAPAMTEPIKVPDGGSREKASGSTVEGAFTRYIVARGDVAIEIGFRFGVDRDQLTDAEGNRLSSSPTIYPGDEIRITAPLVGQERLCYYGLPESFEELNQCRRIYGY